ncbi:constitutive coactivator of PPAR-gamma-like protein 2 isoform X2 [Ornithodoros turicata]|uniref:constitutive coactivator of PPAR-gamma-like protein 2 isoform X2 n=1 Tax=Ornithodoros turicata TaxID=34597 RepID=UPI00313891A1
MGIQALQRFIEANCPGACVPVDLLKIARTAAVRRTRQPYLGNRLCLVVDGECCLDRLYGGYFSDWVCGGQWNRMVQFLSVLIQTIQNNNIELAVFFNGSLEAQRMDEWVRQQQAERKKVNQVLKHLAMKATPPPKVWWIAPVGLRTCLRMALRHLNVTVMCTMDDHHQEVIAFCRENGFHGLMAEDAEYAIFDPPRYFSSEQLKLTYKGSLETKEFILDQVARSLNLHPNRFCILAALLGNYLLSEEDLAPFHHTLCPELKGKAIPAERLIPAVVSFVRSLPAGPDDLEAVASKVFPGEAWGLRQRFRHCVQYYLNGTRDGFLRYRPTGRRQESGSYPSQLPPITEQPLVNGNDTPNDVLGKESATQVVTNGIEAAQDEHVENDVAQVNGVASSISSTCSPGGRQSPAAPQSPKEQNSPGSSPKTQVQTIPKLPKVPPEVMRTASERHQKALMSPWIYQLLSQGEVKLPVAIEEEVPREIPQGAMLFRPLRQMVYAVLFNLHHLVYVATRQKSTSSEMPSVVVHEWVGGSSMAVEAVQLSWPVPTVQRLWLGPSLDDKKCRLRAFLTCMRSDVPLMLNTAYVPQHLLIMCCVLRYMMSECEKPILRKQELDAFLAQAVSPQLMNAQCTQSMQLPLVSVRGSQLASLFLQGVENALFANDACGAPVPWLMCCPWLFFDGKLFHHKLLRAAAAKSLVEVCNGQIDQVAKVERMRTAILEGLQVEFARSPLPSTAANRLGCPRGALLARGGQLEIAGVVVGSWGANYGQTQVPPARCGMGRGILMRRPLPRRPGLAQFNRRAKKKSPKSKDDGKGRGCTIETEDNCTVQVGGSVEEEEEEE